MTLHNDSESEEYFLDVNGLDANNYTDDLNVVSYGDNREMHNFPRINDLDEYNGCSNNLENNTESIKKRKFEKKKGKKSC